MHMSFRSGNPRVPDRQVTFGGEPRSRSPDHGIPEAIGDPPVLGSAAWFFFVAVFCLLFISPWQEDAVFLGLPGVMLLGFFGLVLCGGWLIDIFERKKPLQSL